MNTSKSSFLTSGFLAFDQISMNPYIRPVLTYISSTPEWSANRTLLP
jgi:hypothetical protein